MRDYMKMLFFIIFIMIVGISILYVLHILFDFPLLLEIGNYEYIPRAMIWLLYTHNCQKLLKRLTRKLKFNEKYKTIL